MAENYTNIAENYVALVTRAGERYLDAVATVQDAIVEGVRKLPVPAGAAAGLLAGPEKAANAGFDFAEKLLAQQKKYVDAALGALAPQGADE
jgi:hypothetical protein